MPSGRTTPVRSASVRSYGPQARVTRSGGISSLFRHCEAPQGPWQSPPGRRLLRRLAPRTDTVRPYRSRLQWVHEDVLEDGGVQDHFFGLECRGRAGELPAVFLLTVAQNP